jgi:hypothetical protein
MRWLVYYRTMAPTATTTVDGLLQRRSGRSRRSGRRDCVVCEEKHMSSIAVVVVARSGNVFFDGSASRAARPQASSHEGRPFFDDPTRTLLDKVRDGIAATDLWDTLATDWLVFDAELHRGRRRPRLLRTRYASVGAAPRRARARTHSSAQPSTVQPTTTSPPAHRPPRHGRALRRRVPPVLLDNELRRRPASRRSNPRRRGSNARSPCLAHGSA